MNYVTHSPVEQLEEQVEGISIKKKRGQSQMHNVHARKERKLILLNILDQPIGPTEDIVTELSTFLAAKNWALTTIRDDWRRHRSELKINYYDPYDNDEIRMAKNLVIFQNVSLERSLGSRRNLSATNPRKVGKNGETNGGTKENYATRSYCRCIRKTSASKIN
ncbi:uncharacterized protein LOC107031652 isoform X1 [Solanum pennellii]|uniref:Uncharacterized protein LOC107031652 isoform X1 n=1 Tax=Solanum pennellii TaxID=28526 RepID=A0ABM1HPQ3_SOLPN|nr:uncharacterized protein LOC107031652 isoform X1 [Solanum pennellii]XP_015088579.1 uncharacterized protein LOC107031652 isoform X1 [Solanum pennellii]XP_027767559.1 uncharacterized protein LOC107031652 isoform X1 [Solanum pennellii]